MCKRFFGSLLIIAICASLAYATPLTLNEAVERTLSRNPEVSAAKSRSESAGAAILKSYWLPDPKLGFDFEGIPRGSADLNDADMQFLTISQTIPWPGMLVSEGNAALSRAEMEKNSYNARQREIIRNVKTAYYELSRTDELIKIMWENVELARSAYVVSQSRYVSGDIPQTDVLKMQIELNLMENELANMIDERGVVNRQLGLLMNSGSEESFEVEILPSAESGNLEYGRIVELAMANSPMLKMERAALDESRSMVGAAYSSYFPEIMAKIRRQNTGPTVGSSDFMVEFSLPLWFLLRQNYDLAAAYKNVEASEADYNAAENMILREVKERFTMYEVAGRKLRLYDGSLLFASRSVLEASLADYRGGKIDFLNLADSFRTYLNISKGYYEVLVNYHKRMAELEEVVGVELISNGGK